MVDNDVPDGERSPTLVAIVPHTHWDREWSGHFAYLRVWPKNTV